MDAITDPEVEEVVVMKSARIGWTKILNHTIAYHIHQDPCPMMLVQPTEIDVKGYSQEELAPMLRDTPVLKGLVGEARSRDSKNTILNKSFPGGQLHLIGANSARGFRRITTRLNLYDEYSGWSTTTTEGDQETLAKRRTDTFWNRKFLFGSTPGVKGICRIEKKFKKSDKRYYNVPCPSYSCRGPLVLKWRYLQWPEGKPEKAFYRCEHCEKEIPHSKKRWMVERGEWIATEPFKGKAGFFIWAAYSYSPNAAWGQLATEHVEIKRDFEKTRDPSKRKAYTNTVMGETWEEPGETVDDNALLKRRETYNAVIPMEAGVLVCGVDIQKDRIELEVIGYGKGKESWGIEYTKLYGNTAESYVWDSLDEYLLRTWRHESGVKLHIACTCVDSGYRIDEVLNFVYKKGNRRIFAIKGASTAGKPIVSNPTAQGRRKIPLFTVGTDTAKDVIYARLLLDEFGPGYMHFPGEYNVEYFAQLTGEKKVSSYNKGILRHEWVKTRARNEALDIRVYALAALEMLNPDLEALVDGLQPKEEPEEPQEERPKRRSKWMQGSRGGWM